MILTLYVKPNARENKILAWVDEDTIKISITAVPEKGKANKAIINFLSKQWKIPKTYLVITRGTTAKIKQLTIPDEYWSQIKKTNTH